MPVATSLALRSAVSVARITSRSPSRASTPPSSSATTAAASGVRTTVRPVGACSVSSCSCSTSRPRSSTPMRVHSCSTSASRWLDRKIVVPRACSTSSSSRTSRMPCGSRPFVGSSRTSSSGWRSSAPARPSRWRIPSEYALTGRLPTPPRPTCSSASSTLRRRAAAPPAPGPLASSSRRLVRPLRCPYAAGPSTSAPTDRSTSAASRGMGRPSSSIVPDVASTSPSSIRTVVVFPEPLAPRKP